MVIPRRFVDEMVAHAREGTPEEVCGFLAVEDGEVRLLRRVTNAEHSERFYVMDSQEQLRAIMDIETAGMDVGAVYHSHPATEPRPSETDIRLAQWPGIDYVIVSLRDEQNPELRAWRIEHGAVTESELRVLD